MSWVRLTFLIPTLLLIGACYDRIERQMDTRLLTMENHLIEAFEGIDAVKRGDRQGFAHAMRRLGKAGEVPGVQADALLEQLRSDARDLAMLREREEQAAGLVALTSRCQACHAANAVSLKTGFAYETPARELFAAIVWEDEVRWAEAAAKLPGGGLAEAPDWSARRKAFAEALAR